MLAKRIPMIALTALLTATQLLSAQPADGNSSKFSVTSFEPYGIPNSNSKDLKKFSFKYDGKEDYAIIDESASPTWVVYFHSYGGSALEIYNSPLIHPLWLDSVKAVGFGLVSFETAGNSWMAPYVADSIHHALAAVRKEFGVKNFVFIGGSMGGSAVLTYCVRYPEDVFAALAMCPVSDIALHYEESQQNPDPGFYMKSWPVAQYYGDSEALQKANFELNSVQKNFRKLTMPLVVAHGTADTMISVSQTDKLAKLLEGKKDFKYFRYPNANHSYPSVEGFKESWPWLIEQVNVKLKKGSSK
jgi:pimeloyl-ACP methyl ester carboxylesterase